MACIGRWVTLASLLAVGAPVPPPVPRKFVMRLPPFTFTKKLSRSEMRWSMRTGGRAVGRNRYFEIGGDQRFAPGSVGSGVIPQIFLASGLSRWLGITLLTKGTRTAMSRLERVDFGFRMSDFGSLSGKGLPEIRHPKSDIRNL